MALLSAQARSLTGLLLWAARVRDAEMILDVGVVVGDLSYIYVILQSMAK
jgi:hypothetical protein